MSDGRKPSTAAGRALLEAEMWDRLHLAIDGDTPIADEEQFTAAILSIEAEAAQAERELSLRTIAYLLLASGGSIVIPDKIVTGSGPQTIVVSHLPEQNATLYRVLDAATPEGGE